MRFPFKVGVPYFTQDQLNHVAFVVENEPLSGAIYKNDKKEQRKVFRVAYPTGLITNDTVYDEDHPEMYHTPLATVGESREAKIWFIHFPSGEHDVCYSREWFEWLGDGKLVKNKPDFEAAPNVKRQIDAAKARVMSEQKVVEEATATQAVKNEAVAEFKDRKRKATAKK